MKLTYEDKVRIYELRKQGISLKQLSEKYGMNLSNLKSLVRLIDRYGIESVKKEKNRYYSPELKEEKINIDYYNNKRIKVKLKGLSPVQYRTKSFG